MSGPWFFNAQYNFYANSYADQRRVNLLYQTLSITPGYQFQKGALTLPLAYTHEWVHEDQYMAIALAKPTVSYLFLPQHIGQFSMGYMRREMLTDPPNRYENRPGTVGMVGPTLEGYDASYRLDPREAIVILGELPPQADYFGLQTYLLSRPGEWNEASYQYQFVKAKVPALLGTFCSKLPKHDERLQQFADVFVNFFTKTRWRRTLMVIRSIPFGSPGTGPVPCCGLRCWPPPRSRTSSLVPGAWRASDRRPHASPRPPPTAASRR